MPMTLSMAGLVAEQAMSLFGAEPTSLSGLAEALRCELFARVVTSGRTLCERVRTFLQPLGLIDVARIRAVLDELATCGDVTAGPRGQFSAAPLRAVRLAADRFALHGTIPTGQLRQELTGINLEEGLTRRARLAEGQEQVLNEAVERLSGLVLSAERWTGLDRVLPAGPEWIAELDYRLEEGGSGPETLGQEKASPWQAYRPEVGGPQRQRWRTWHEEDSPARLWRTCTEQGWWWYAWTAGRDPTASRFLRLGQEEACRSQFALDRQAGTSLSFPARRQGGIVEIAVEAFLPQREYRYLTTMGERCAEERSVCYRVPVDVWGQVAGTIHDRLGVMFVEEVS